MSLREQTANYRVPRGEVRLAEARRKALLAASKSTIEASAIRIEKSHAALLLVGGGDDQTGASGESVRQLARRLKRLHYRHPVEALVYPDAGHLIVDTGWRPTTNHNSGPSQDGGNARSDAEAQAGSWNALAAFLKRELHPATRPPGQALRNIFEPPPDAD